MTAPRRARRSGISIAEFLNAFPDEKSCLEYIFYHRHDFAPLCPKCKSPASFRLVEYRRAFLSSCCGYFVSPTAKTILDHTRIPVRMWLYALLLYGDMSPGLSQNALGRLVGIGKKHAWAMADRMRTHIALTNPEEQLGGDGCRVYVDEAQIRIGPQQQHCVLLGITDGMRCIIRIVDDRSAEALVGPIVEMVKSGSVIISDGWPSYNCLEKFGFAHRQVVHLRKMWVNAEGDCMTYVEGLWAMLKRLLQGKSAQISNENLWKFVGEVVYRYNAGLDPAQAWWRLITSFRGIEMEDIEAARHRIDRRLSIR